jgi:outer membrane protein assembly factor BamB
VTSSTITTSEVQRSSVQYPGGLSGRYRWAGSGRGESVFGLSEAGGEMVDHGKLAGSDPERLCRAELRIEGPLGPWTARFASPIYDEPTGVFWDDLGLLLVKYGFLVYALDGRTGELRWSFRSGTPLLSVLASSRLGHVLAQGEVETTALRGDGEVAWRATHSDVVVGAELVGGRLVLTSYGGERRALDPATGLALD